MIIVLVLYNNTPIYTPPPPQSAIFAITKLLSTNDAHRTVSGHCAQKTAARAEGKVLNLWSKMENWWQKPKINSVGKPELRQQNEQSWGGGGFVE